MTLCLRPQSNEDSRPRSPKLAASACNNRTFIQVRHRFFWVNIFLVVATLVVSSCTSPKPTTTVSVHDGIDRLLSTADAAGCHAEAHDLGRSAASTLEVSAAFALNTPELDDRCQFGFLHGLFQGYASLGLDSTTVADEGCSTLPSPSALSECFHAAGHGIALSTNDLNEALGVCTTFVSNFQDPCAGGAFMEYSERLRGAFDPAHQVELLDSDRAASICEWTHQRWRMVCALEAVKFWSQTETDPVDLATKCAALAAGIPEVLDRCANGLGRWLQNQVLWGGSDSVGVPATADEASKVSVALADACLLAASTVPAVAVPCLEYATHPLLIGQVSSGANPDTWIDPCTGIPAHLSEVRAECENVRTDIIAQASRP